MHQIAQTTPRLVWKFGSFQTLAPARALFKRRNQVSIILARRFALARGRIELGLASSHLRQDMPRIELSNPLRQVRPLRRREDGRQVPKTTLEAVVERQPCCLENVNQAVGNRRRRQQTATGPPTRHRLAGVNRQHLPKLSVDHLAQPGSLPHL
jgi:hypothetical protein